MSKKSNNATVNNAKQSMLDVSTVLDKLNIDDSKYYVLRCYDVEEFNEVAVYRKSYACIKERISNRVILKLWGHKTFVSCECSKTLRKSLDVSKKIYTEKKLSKNNNYECNSVATATTLCNDFLSQVDKYLCSLRTATATEKTATAKKAN